MVNTKRARSSEWSEETPDDDTEGEDELESSEMEYSDSESDYDGRKTNGKGKNKVAIREKGLAKRHRAVSSSGMGQRLTPVLREMSTRASFSNPGKVRESAEEGREAEESGRRCDPGRRAGGEARRVARGELCHKLCNAI